MQQEMSAPSLLSGRRVACANFSKMPHRIIPWRPRAEGYVLEVQWGVAMHAAGLGPTFFEEVYLSLPRTYPIKVRKYKKNDAGQPLSGVFSTDAT